MFGAAPPACSTVILVLMVFPVTLSFFENNAPLPILRKHNFTDSNLHIAERAYTQTEPLVC